MRTVKGNKEELKKAQNDLEKHRTSCFICHFQAESEEEELVCVTEMFLIDECEALRHSINYSEKIFQQELIERNSKQG